MLLVWCGHAVAHQTGPLGVSSQFEIIAGTAPARQQRRPGRVGGGLRIPLSAPPALPATAATAATAPIDPFEGLTDPLLYEVEGNWEDIDDILQEVDVNATQVAGSAAERGSRSVSRNRGLTQLQDDHYVKV